MHYVTCRKQFDITKKNNLQDKGQKTSKAIFLETPLPEKTDEILDKIQPYEARAEFCQIFCSFFGKWSFKK